MSIELTLARAEMRIAEDNWKAHVLHCPHCSEAVRDRKWSALCTGGHEVHGLVRAARAAVARERELDAQPLPDQETLF